MTRHVTIACLLACTTALPSFAADATADGAARLTTTFQRYLGTTEGVVTVTPNGAIYDVRLDAAPLLAGFIAEGGQATVSPIDFTLADRGDGKWDVAQDQPLNLAVDIPDVIKVDFTAESSKLNGVFDENLRGFTETTQEIVGMKLDEVVHSPAVEGQDPMPPTSISYNVDKISGTSTGTAGASGGIDGTMSMVAQGVHESFSLPPGPDMAMSAPMQIEFSAESYDANGTYTDMQMGDILEIVAWMVAHPTPEAAQADTETLKGLARNAIPLWQNLSMTGTMNALNIVTPIGPVTAESAEVAVDMNGIVAEGMLREKIALSGLTLPEGAVPPWISSLVPHELTLDATVDGFDLATPAGLFLDAVSPTGELTPEVETKMGEAFMPSGTVHINLAPTNVTGEIYKVDAEGDLTVGPAQPMPAGSFTVKAEGLDAVMEKLKEAPPEVGQQAGMGLAMAKGLAKSEGTDSYSWLIEMKADGSFTVNGNDMSGAMGGGTP